MFSFGSFFVFYYFLAMASATATSQPPDCTTKAIPYVCSPTIRNLTFQAISAKIKGAVYDCDLEKAAFVKSLYGDSQLYKEFPKDLYRTAIIFKR
ncbi:hypothetical protein Y032_0157g3216 [Ancylostoma ceylanicum]|nr:hypothetical protein Y032_0157g3216 [Ancylostoma ceylanicum]